MKKVGLFFGGMSNEHEISISSAKNIIKHIDTTKYEVVLLFWTKEGFFYKLDDISQVNHLDENKRVFFEEITHYIDIALPMTHGKYGEDGVLQGLCERQKIPYCGCHVLGSSICMDKGIFKELMKLHEIEQTAFEVMDLSLLSPQEVAEKLVFIDQTFTFPLYVKPANSGSSLGISRVEDRIHLQQAVLEASQHDSKIVIEEGLLSPQEIEIAILGNEHLIISEPGALILTKDFYDYEDKYKHKEAKVEIPANIPEHQKRAIKQLAERIYKICECRGFARVDFFIVDDKIYVNEINTLPGFTDISMFPMLMQYTGMSYTDLIDKIITSGASCKDVKNVSLVEPVRDQQKPNAQGQSIIEQEFSHSGYTGLAHLYQRFLHEVLSSSHSC